jgi:hypothetical protein
MPDERSGTGELRAQHRRNLHLDKRGSCLKVELRSSRRLNHVIYRIGFCGIVEQIIGEGIEVLIIVNDTATGSIAATGSIFIIKV